MGVAEWALHRCFDQNKYVLGAARYLRPQRHRIYQNATNLNTSSTMYGAK
jgi:hypothetical protein